MPDTVSYDDFHKVRYWPDPRLSIIIHCFVDNENLLRFTVFGKGLDAIDPSLDIGFGEVDYYPGQVMYLCADISALTEDTGFVPEYDFETGIKETVEWYKNEYGS